MAAQAEHEYADSTPDFGPPWVRAQALFRELNDRINRWGQSQASAGYEIVCECSERGCQQTLYLPVSAYEAVRRFPTRFIVAAGHQNDTSERLVDDHGTYAVVEKFGAEAVAAVRLDPRRRATS